MEFRYKFKNSGILMITHESGDPIVLHQHKKMLANGTVETPLFHLQNYLNDVKTDFNVSEELFKLYTRYQAGYKLEDIPMHIFKNILKVIDFNDVLNWVKRTTNVPPRYKIGGKTTLSQLEGRTFSHSDYLELIALTIVYGALIPIASNLVVKSKIVSGDYGLVIVANMLTSTSLFMTEIGKKLIDNIETIHKTAPKEFLTIDKVLSFEETEHLLTTLILGKLVNYDYRNDNNGRNIITWLFNYSILVPSLKERAKSSVVEDKSSTFELQKTVNEFPTNVVEEYMWITEDWELFSNQYAPLTKEEVKLAMYAKRIIEKGFTITDAKMGLASVAIKHYINPNGLLLLGKNRIGHIDEKHIGGLKHCFMLAFVKIFTIDNLLGEYILSTVLSNETMLVGNISPISTDEIEEVFPFIDTSIISSAISIISTELRTGTYSLEDRPVILGDDVSIRILNLYKTLLNTDTNK